jgi:23S rRNA (cytosine1962-C5)-methyltransferase
VVLVLAGCAAPYADAICASIAGRVPGATVVRRDHRDDLRREEVRSRRFGGSELDPEAVVQALELGVAYPLRPFAGLATGIYVDQRATRAWLRPQAAGRRVLNLFAYTGAFSVSLLAAGAAQAIDVDLAAPALRRAEEAAALNGVADRHRTVHADCRQYLAASTERFDLVIADPPTAAQGGESWVLRRDYPDLLRLAAARLAPGGLLVACCNTIGGKPYPLVEVVRQAATAAEVAVTDVPVPELGEDIPALRGFPEGRPYRLMAVRAA